MVESDGSNELRGASLVDGTTDGVILGTDLELSFWGGVDPASGEIIDRHHPLSGQLLTGKVLAVPGSRGSCTGSAVLLELLLNGKGPAAILVARPDDILTLGVVIAADVFGRSIPVIALEPDGFALAATAPHARIVDGRVSLSARAEPFAKSADEAAPGAAPASRAAVRLTARDRAILGGAEGRAAQAAMRIVVRMAGLYGAEQLVDVTQVHIDGCIYTGPGSLRFAERMRDWGGRVAVPTTLNAISVDHRRWRDQGVDPAFAGPASALADAYLAMGAAATYTCAPYLLETAPGAGEQVAWGESNAVAFANSVLGARTMKYPDFLDLCIALTGRAPLAGAHLTSGRRPTIRIEVAPVDAFDDAFFPLLGYHVGVLAADRIPIVTGLAETAPSRDDLKAFGAAFATTSGAPMFHIVGVTPEAAGHDPSNDRVGTMQTAAVGVADLRRSWAELDSAHGRPVGLVALGNPHLSLAEIERLASLCRGRRKHAEVSVVVTSGRAIHEKAVHAGLVSELEAFGVRFVTDTCWCMIGAPLIPHGTGCIMTNSAKYAHYGPGLTGKRFGFGSLEACVEAACRGSAPAQLPAWLRDSG
ncbi:aconitase X [Chthonobacter albigriseus]|uniref:cis-3-hydroxy-L-proline dehydratase n=1 Tax=Chthonobacter albigriseus TaxID=1683161 RepID=UPI0015EF6CB0|nr:aconitase family protein [Chthonobacter albigriseus]